MLVTNFGCLAASNKQSNSSGSSDFGGSAFGEDVVDHYTHFYTAKAES